MRAFLRILISFIRPYKGFVMLNILFNLLGVVFSLFSLVLIGPFLSVLFGMQGPAKELMPWELSKEAIVNNFNYHIGAIMEQHGPQTALLFISGLVVLMFLLKTGNIYLANFFMAPIRNGVVRDLRNRIYQKMLVLPIGFYNQERKGDILARITQDVQEVEWSVMASLEKLFRDPINMMIFFTGMMIMSPALTAFVLILLPVSALIIGNIGKNLRKQSQRSQKQMGVIMSMVEETLSGLRIIKSFNAESFAEKRFHNENNLFTRIMNRITRRRDLASPLSEFLGALVVVGLIAYGGNLVLLGKGPLSPASFIAYIAIFTQILTPAKSFSTAYYHLNKGLASFDRINELLNQDARIFEVPEAISINEFKNQIDYDRVSFDYGQGEVLKDISITLRKGKTIALVGASGSGKSTFIDLLLRFHDTTNGSIHIDGNDIRLLKIIDMRNLFAYVPQESLLFNDSFTNNIAFGEENPDPDRIRDAARASDSLDFIHQNGMGFETHIGDRGGRLSGGQRQRIGIARAVYSNRPVLILDEATSALDNETEERVFTALAGYYKNRTILIVAHRLSTIRRADEIIVFRDGRILDQGCHEDLMSRCSDYQRLYQKEEQ